MVPKVMLITALLGSLSQVKASHGIDNGIDFSGSDRNFLEKTLYHPDLKCGECVAGGHNFCWKAQIPGEMIEDVRYPQFNNFNSSSRNNLDTEQRCCWNDRHVDQEHRNQYCENIVYTTGGENHESKWICSNSYKDTTYGLHVCPFKRSACGPRSTIDFYKIEDDGAIEIKGLMKGEACTYNLGSVCGAPSFKVGDFESKGVDIYYAEWQQDFIMTKTPVNQITSLSDAVKDASPLQGMPQRNQDFTYEGEGIPGSTTPRTGKYLGVEWKAWGNNNQGNDDDLAVARQGRRYNEDDFECKQRHMIISVVAKQDNVELLLELQSLEFLAINIKFFYLMALLPTFALLTL